jgi:hypothetical protein
VTRRAAELLARLRRHELDRQRLLVAATAGEVERVRKAIRDQVGRLAIEHALAFELPGGPQPLAPYAEAAQRHCRALGERTRALENRLDQARAVLRDGLRDWKSLDLAVAELQAKERAETTRRDRLQVEEATLLRRAAQNSGASVTSSPSSGGPNLIWQDSRELSRTS